MTAADDAATVARALRESVLFAGIDDAQVRLLAGSAEVVRRAAGAPVFRSGDAADGLYVVASGTVAIAAGAARRDVGEGDFFGELAVLDHGPRSADAVASSDAVVVRVPAAALLREIEQRPRVADRLVTVLRQRRHSDDAYEDVPGRLALAVRSLASADSPAPVVEVFVVLLRDGVVRRLASASPDELTAPAGPSPHATVAQLVGAYGLEPVVVHSTSWRTEHSLVLTYLAAVRPPAAAPAGMAESPVGRHDLARGTADAAPHRIEAEHVLEHALRHLAWLIGDDPGVAHAVGDAWARALAGYSPEPFRAL